MNLVKIGGVAVALAAVAAIVMSMRGEPLTPETPEDGASRMALTEAVDAFGAAMRDRDFETVIGTIPPAVMSSLAEKLGLADDAIRPAMQRQMEATLGVIDIVEFKMDTASAELKDIGGGVTYAILDTQTVMKTDGKTVEAKTPTLALFVDGKWHLMRIDSKAQQGIVFDVYPDLKDVALPESSMNVIDG